MTVPAGRLDPGIIVTAIAEAGLVFVTLKAVAGETHFKYPAVF
jgi:hypothetical protein